MAEKTFKMPPVELGVVVHWYPGGGRNLEPHVGIVTRVGNDNLNLNLFLPQSYNLLIRDGVRHIDDPRAKTQELAEQGAWDYTPLHKRFLQLLSLLEEPKKK